MLAQASPEEEAALLTTDGDRLKELASKSKHLAFIVAQNPANPGALLQQLASSGWGEIEQEVAKNPNAPQETLFK